MKKALLALLLLCGTVLAGTGDGTMPVAEIKTGMRGIGKTVFAGSTIEDFDFEVLDILPNFKSKRDLILVKLLGEKVEHTSVVAGMSGSPMYIDGKLIGALAYQVGPLFPKDPIAGVTPIAQMLDILERERTRNAELALNRGYNTDFVNMALGAKEVSLLALVPPRLTAGRAMGEVVALRTPLYFTGFESGALRLASSLLEGSGAQMINGGSAVETENSKVAPLEPGSAYAIVLVDGDMGLQATGTVTYVNEGQVIGMGHPFFNYGAVSLPMGTAKIVATLSSLMASTKLSTLTGVTGIVHQDRSSGVMGVEGEVPSMIPFDLSVESALGEINQYSFRVAEDRSLHSLTPIIFSIVMTNALESARMSVGNRTLQLEGSIELQGHAPIPLQNYFAGGTPGGFLTDGVQAAGELAATIGTLLANDFECPEIKSVKLTLEALPKKQLAHIERVEVNKTVVKPGESVRVTVHIREFQGKEHKVTHNVIIPDHVKARRIGIFAGSGVTLTRLEARTSPHRFRPKNFSQLVKMLNERRKNNFVFFQIRQPDQGVLVEGKESPGLPPSVLSVVRAQKSSGNLINLRDRVLLEESVQTEYAVSGGRNLWLSVEQK